MKKNNKIFIVWGLIIGVIISILTILGFMMKSEFNSYNKLEEKLVSSAKKYVDAKFLYPTGSDTVKVTSTEMIDNDYLDILIYEDDICEGYVIVSFDGVYNYDGYIKCDNYKTSGYEK